MTTVLITGAERGLGLALARAYTDAGATVIALCRASTPALDALAPDVHTGIDVSNAAAVARAAAAVGDVALDVLISNAGIMIEDDFTDIDVAAVRQQFEVNALGPLNVARHFAPRLRRGGKLIDITSRLGSIADNGSGGDYGYRMSKAAQNMLTRNLAIDLAEAGIVVAALHPGIVATDMSGGKGTPPGKVARDLVQTIGNLTDGDSGGFYAKDGSPLPW